MKPEVNLVVEKDSGERREEMNIMEWMKGELNVCLDGFEVSSQWIGLKVTEWSVKGIRHVLDFFWILSLLFDVFQLCGSPLSSGFPPK